MSETRPTIHMVGNAHLDPVWLWMGWEGRQEMIDTCRSALALMEEDDRYVFCCSSAAHYRWVEETDPELFSRIVARVGEGRWVPVGGWWVQPDCNVPSGESLIRQGLYGQRYFRERFGLECLVGYNVDTFGHPWTLAQLLAGMGLKYYVFFRPGPHEKTLPSGIFQWEGPDGSKVLTARPPGHYNTGPEDIEWRIREAASAFEQGVPEVMAFYGVGNHGGGPTRENLLSIRRLMDASDLPRVVFSDPNRFFQAVEAAGASLPTVRDELQHHARGCYTAGAAIKRANREAEHALQTAELWSAVAEHLTNRPPARRGLDSAWQTVLFNQFHDILAGTSLRAACDQAVRENRRVIDAADDETEAAARSIGARIDASGPHQSIVLFNPLAIPREEIAECEVNWRESAPGVAVETPGGEPVPCQVLRSTWSGGGRSVSLLVRAMIPPCGYATLRARPLGEVGCTEPASRESELDNGVVVVRFGRGPEWIRAIVSRSTGMSAVREGCGGGIVIDDPSDTWSHGVDRFREEVGRFELVGTPEVLEAGPLRWKARAVGRYRDSWLIQEISLFEGRSEVYACAEVRWHEKHRMLKLAVPTCIVDGRGTFEIAYGAIERPQTGDEEPGQRWADLSGVPAGASGVPCGVALLNDGKYGFDVQDGEIRMSVLRSPIYAFHDPAQVQPGESYEYMEQGVHVFRYAIAPHAGDWRAAGIPRLAAAFNRPCLALHEPAHGGPLPPTYSFASTNSSHVDVETVKPAECGEGVTLRLRETFGEATDCVLTLTESQAIPLTFAAWEIKTLVARRVGDQWLVRETDLLERGGNFGDRQSR